MSVSETPRDTVACEWAQWVSNLTFDDLPDHVIDVAKECFRDGLACAILGSSLPNTSLFLKAIQQVSEGGGSTVIMTPWRASIRDAVFMNAIFTHGCELDDGFFDPPGGHPAGVIVPVTLALAEDGHLGGRDVITAIVAGYEIMQRATVPIYHRALQRGFVGNGIGGPFGSTAAAAKLRELPAATIAQAFGIAGSYCSGLCEYDQSGGESKRLYSATTARAGVESIEMALAGITGPLTIFEGPRGVWSAFADRSEPLLATENLGTDFRILRHRIKTYPTVSSIHGAIDAIVAMSLPPLRASDIQEVTAKVIPTTIRHGGTVQVPWDMLSAQFSLAFSIALRIMFGRNDLALYQDPVVRSNPEVTALCQKVHAVAFTDAEIRDEPNASAIVTVTLSDGATRTHVQHAPSGTPANPLTPDQLRERFFELTRPVMSERTQFALDEAIEHLEVLKDLDTLLEMLRP